jgi:Wiskott-Aldrich syndrome protein
MRGYLQRLVEAHAPPSTAPPLKPAVRSTSPIFEADQRLELVGFADAAPSVSAESDRAITAPAAGESRQSAAPAPAVPPAPPGRSPAPPAVPAMVQRRATPATGLAPTFAPPRAAAGPAQPGIDPARPEPTAPLAPSFGAAHPPTIPPPTEPTASGFEVMAITPRPVVAPIPEAGVLGLDELSQPPRRPPVSPGVKPVTVPTEAAELWDPSSIGGAPAPALGLLSPAPPPDSRAPAELVEARPRPSVEPNLPAHAGIPSPETRPQSVIIRETIRAPEPASTRPQAPPPKAPRSAAEASVIGPLDRRDRLSARLDLWLR